MIRHEPTILVVDDEPEVGRYIAATLSRSGFRTLLAIGGRAAVAQFQARQRDIGLVLTDIVMGDLAGPAMVTALREIEPAVKVLYMSGYGSWHTRRHGEELEGVEVLSKPFTAEELIERVKKALGIPVSTYGASGS